MEQTLKENMPIIRKALIVNCFLFLYFISPTFLSFLAISLIIFTTVLKKHSRLTPEMLTCSNGCSFTKCIKESLQRYKSLTLTKRTHSIT
jgi:hypothetical protein